MAAAISGQYPGLLWEASHLGGDRFAGNMVVLPRGDYFGRLDGDDGVRVVRSYLAGEPTSTTTGDAAPSPGRCRPPCRQPGGSSG